LLRGAQYGGTWDSANGYQPLAYGKFDVLKAVHRSGYIDCSLSRWDNIDIPWNRCSVYSFELKKNGVFLIEALSADSASEGCSVDTSYHAAGDITCNVPFTLQSGDTLTPTWFEASHQQSTYDNAGTITIDLYGHEVVSAPF
jgi:hypothetical protein